jgi:two-component system, OmpR family, sensor kinase
VKLATRLWLWGALVPFAGTATSLLAAGQLFRGRLETAVDEALLSQAAVEAVSMFDGPNYSPHLHITKSPLRQSVGHVVPAITLYETDGAVKIRYPRDAREGWTADRLSPDDVTPEPRLEDRRLADGTRLRVVSVEIRSPTGEPHALQLAASLAGVDTAVAEYHRTGVLMALLLGAALFVLQIFLARRLRGRLTALTGHMAAVREGHLDAVPPRPEGKDEIAELTGVVAEATARLRGARAAQDLLVAEAAHELRTPLTLMRTSIDLALRRRREVPELVQSLEETRREVDRLAHLSTRLLDLATARRGSWDRTPGDLAEVAREAAEAARAAAEERHLLVQVMAPSAVPSAFDPHGLRQAVDNLIANAIKFSPARTAITIAVGESEGIARIVVQDEGPGIPAEERERLFMPFERGRKGPRGAGLGLAIVREIAQGHGGRAYVADAPRGTRVVIELPVVQAVGVAARAS